MTGPVNTSAKVSNTGMVHFKSKSELSCHYSNKNVTPSFYLTVPFTDINLPDVHLKKNRTLKQYLS